MSIHRRTLAVAAERSNMAPPDHSNIAELRKLAAAICGA